MKDLARPVVFNYANYKIHNNHDDNNESTDTEPKCGDCS